jgi:polygalacturonase
MKANRHFILLITGFLTFLTVPGTNAAEKVFDVRDYGAKGDGKTLDTAAIQKALNECGRSGGTVRVPAGTYVSGPVTLRTKTTLQLDEGATLQAMGDQTAFLKSGTNWLAASGSGDFYPFIGGKGLTDVTITGKGTIDGAGENWWGPAEEARRKKPGYTLPRPRLIVLTESKNVKLSGVTLQNSPTFHFVPTDCDDVVVEGVTVKAPAHSANTDAIDPSRCRRVLITKCDIDVGDDNIAIKAGKKVPGREFASEDITITDCVFRHGHGCSIGSETVGGVHNVTVKNCTFENTENGIRIKSYRGRGGVVDNVKCSNITMKNVDPAITLTCVYGGSSAGDALQATTPLGSEEKSAIEGTPVFRNVHIRNLKATAQRNAGIILGLPDSPISDVILENIEISSSTGMTIKNAKGIQLKNVKVTPNSGSPFLVENAQVEGISK